VNHRIIGSVAILVLTVWLRANMAAADFTPIAGWDHHLFPSFIVATATLNQSPDDKADAEKQGVFGHPENLLGVSLKSPADNASVKVTVSGDAVMEPSSITAVLPKKGKEYEIYPKIKYKYAALVQNKQLTPITLTFSVEVKGSDPEEESVAVNLRSINDCPRELNNDEKEPLDLHFTYAAYVNEEHPLVDEITKDALDSEIVDSFSGYSKEPDPKDVIRQVYALWHVLNKRGVRYSDASTTAAESEAVSSQRVRLLEDSMDNAQANCVDGSVLFASALRKIGVEPFLVLVPGHCYVGFYIDEDQKQPLGIETTMIGAKSDSDDERTIGGIEGLEGIENEAWTNDPTWQTFVGALKSGTEDLAKNQKKFNSEDKKNSEYQIISIAAARQVGIIPIPYLPSEKKQK
jgi:hypothetical protein